MEYKNYVNVNLSKTVKFKKKLYLKWKGQPGSGGTFL